MNSDPDLVDLLIIGGGASAVAVLAAIAKACPEISVLVAEKSPLIGLGVAYATELEQHILNVPAQAMGIDPAHPTGFLDWASTNEPSVKAADFVPRITYGRYLKHILQHVLAAGLVKIWHTEVLSLEKKGQFFYASGADGTLVNAKNVILALGHTALELPIKKIKGDAGQRVVLNPWKKSGYEKLEAIKSILILGTGLTAMDVVAAIDQRGYQGQITLISRRGLIPFSSYGEGDLKEVVLTEQTLRLSLRELVAWIRSESDNMKVHQLDWRALIDAFRPYTKHIWRRFSERERSQFLRHLRPYWEVIRHRMPNAARVCIDDLQVKGRLRIVRARILELDAESQESLHVKLSIAHGENELAVDRLFNCTGGVALKPDRLPALLSSLHQQGLLKLDSFGLGVRTGTNGELLNQQGDIVVGCYLIGPLRRATDWESTAMREIREQAGQIVDELAKTF
jgi:uncharacterized NAD(P)/FAD-binding protein YdhS